LDFGPVFADKEHDLLGQLGFIPGRIQNPYQNQELGKIKPNSPTN
jgi:hypothetical protein